MMGVLICTDYKYYSVRKEYDEEREMIKKYLVVLFALLMATIIVTGCASTTGNTNAENAATVEIVYADQDFITDLAKALEARWALSDSVDYEFVEGTQEHRDSYGSLLQAELDVLSDKNYDNATFKDSKLKEKAISYLNCLHDQEDALTYVTVDYDKYAELWESAYNKRTQLITDFVRNYGLTVSDEYKATLSDMITNASVVDEKQHQEEAIQKLVNSISFERVENEDDSEWVTYKAIVENTMDYEIVSLSIDVNLIDKDGVNIATEYVSMDNIASGEKGKLEFSTDEQFEKTKLTVNYYELK